MRPEDSTSVRSTANSSEDACAAAPPGPGMGALAAVLVMNGLLLAMVFLLYSWPLTDW